MKPLQLYQGLRELAEKIKAHTVSQLDTYLEQFEKNAVANGTKVHWAKDGQEHNRIVLNILQSAKATRP